MSTENEKIEVYADYHTPTILYAKDGEHWYIVPSSQDGWRRRRTWAPTTALLRHIATDANRMTFYGQSWLAEKTFGIPRDRVATVATW